MKIAAAGLFAAGLFSAALPIPLAAQVALTPASKAIPAATLSAVPAHVVPAGVTLDLPVEAIATNPKGKAVLDRDMVALLDRSLYQSFRGMSLKQLQSYSSDRITDAESAHAATDLTAIR